jgi:acyl-CoA thioester hydrolase
VANRLLNEYPVTLALPVQWGEQDAFGHVNNTVYFRWCESARIVYLERVGLRASLQNEATGPILARIGCDFRQPVRFPDAVEVGSRVTRMGRSSFDMEHRIVSERLGLVAEAASTLVVYDYGAGRSVAIPEAVRAAIEALEGRAL